MELDDLIKLIVGFLFFLLPTLGRLLRGLFTRGQQPQRQDYAYEDEYEDDGEYEEEHSGSRYDYELEDVEAPELVAHDTSTAEPVEVGPGSSDPRTRAQERMRQQLGDVFRSLGLEVSFERAPPEAAPEVAPREWVPDETVVEDVAEDELFDPNHEQDFWDPNRERDQTREAYARSLSALEEEHDQIVEQVDRIRFGRHLDSESVRSAAVLRDAIVLDALLTRPEFGQLPLKRSPR